MTSERDMMWKFVTSPRCPTRKNSIEILLDREEKLKRDIDLARKQNEEKRKKDEIIARIKLLEDEKAILNSSIPSRSSVDNVRSFSHCKTRTF